jgi:hypothetical protein
MCNVRRAWHGRRSRGRAGGGEQGRPPAEAPPLPSPPAAPARHASQAGVPKPLPLATASPVALLARVTPCWLDPLPSPPTWHMIGLPLCSWILRGTTSGGVVRVPCGGLFSVCGSPREQPPSRLPPSFVDETF